MAETVKVPITFGTYWDSLFGPDSIFSTSERTGGPPITSAGDFLRNAFNGVGNTVLFPPLSQAQAEVLKDNAGKSNAAALPPNATPEQRAAAYKQASGEVGSFITNYTSGSVATDLGEWFDGTMVPNLPWLLVLGALGLFVAIYLFTRMK